MSSDAIESAPTESSAPRTRWAAVVWGSGFAAFAWFAIWTLSDAGRRDSVTDWFAGLSPGTITAFVLLAAGVLVLITGFVGLIRRAQRRLSGRTATTGPVSSRSF